MVVHYLTAFDEANPKVGAERNKTKMEVIYFATAEEMNAHRVQWRLHEVEQQAEVKSASQGTMTLGVMTGPDSSIDEQMWNKVKVVKAMQERVAICQDPQTEHVLNRQSLGIGPVNHLLRVHGSELAKRPGRLEAFDEVTKSATDRLFPGLTADGHEQATLTSVLGGIGWRRASDTAGPACLGARVMARPLVAWMADDAEKAGLLRSDIAKMIYESQTEAMTKEYLQTLDENEKVRAEAFIAAAETASRDRWEKMKIGSSGRAPSAPRAEICYRGEDDPTDGNPELAHLHDGGEGDLEGQGRDISAPHLQKELSKLGDCTRLRRLEEKLRAQCNWAQLARLRDLRHPEVSHRWLWHLDASRGSVLSQADYVINVQKRLGGQICRCSEVCRLCDAPLDHELEHCETCALAEATRGHYTAVRAVVNGLRSADPGVCTEPMGANKDSGKAG